MERLGGFELSWLIETSPGNHQGGIVLAQPITDGAVAARLHNAMIDAGLCDAGARPIEPLGAAAGGDQWQTEIRRQSRRPVPVSPGRMATRQAILAARDCGSTAAGTRTSRKAEGARSHVRSALHCLATTQTTFVPEGGGEPGRCGAQRRGLYKTPLGSGKHDMTCPWVHEHTDELDTGAAYFEPDDQYPLGGFCCQHSHRDKYHIRELLEFLGCRTPKHGTSRSSVWWLGNCIASWTRRKKNWPTVDGTTRPVG